MNTSSPTLDAEFINDCFSKKPTIRDERIARYLTDRLASGRFTITGDVLLPLEPWTTSACMMLDSAVRASDGTVKRAEDRDAVQIDPVILVHVSPAGRIKGPRFRSVPIPGRPPNERRQEKFWFDYGNFCRVEERFPERAARSLLYRGAWPLRLGGSRGADDLIIEHKWLVQQLELGEDAPSGVRELHEEISQRPGFRAFLDQGSEGPTPKKGKA